MFLRSVRPHNPVLERELSHQRRTTALWVQRLDVSGVVIAAMVIAIVMTVYCLNIDFYYDGFYFFGDLETLRLVQVVAGVVYLLVMMRGLLAGIGVMNTQKIGSMDWDLLMLAGMSTQQILIGKWWAALHRIRGWMVALGIIRFALIASLAGQHIFYFYFHEYHQLTYHIQYCDVSYNTIPDLKADCLATNILEGEITWAVEIPILTGMAVVLSLLEGIACTGIGIAAALVFRFNGIAILASVLFRGLPIFILSLTPPEIPIYVDALYNLAAQWYSFTWFAIADGGVTALIRGASMNSARNNPQAIYGAFGVAVLYLGAHIGLAWVVGSIGLRRRGAVKRR